MISNLLVKNIIFLCFEQRQINRSPMNESIEMITHVEHLENSEEVNDDTRSLKVKDSSQKRSSLGNKKRRKPLIVLDDSEEDCAGNYKKKNRVLSDKKKRRRRAEILEDDTDGDINANFDKEFSKKKNVVEQTIKSATRLGKRLFGKKLKGIATENNTGIEIVKVSSKGSERSKQKKRTATTQVY